MTELDIQPPHVRWRSMRRKPTIVALSGFLVGLVFGCSSNTPAPSDGANAAPAQEAGDRPKAVTPDARARLAELEKTIATREKELADLRVAADSLRKEIAAAAGGSEKVYRTPQELFADMPKSAYPKYAEGEIERAAARMWCGKNLSGRTVEWPATIEAVDVDGNDPFRVSLIYGGSLVRGYRNVGGEHVGSGVVFGSEFTLGSEKCIATLSRSNSDFGSPMVQYRDCTAEESRQLRDLKGKKVMLRAKVMNADVGIYEGKSGTPFIGNLLGIYVDTPTVDGFYPKAGKR